MRKTLNFALLLALTGAFVYAQPPQLPPGVAPQEDLGDDPPGRAGRLSFMTGTVSFQPGGVEDWIPASLNRPMTTGDRLWTEAGSRAEVHLGSSAIRLNGRTSFTFLNLHDNTTQVQISMGSLSVRLRRLDDNESFEIDTPNVAFTLLRPGEYRVDVNEQGDATVVTVRGGEGEASAGGQLFPVKPRQQVRVSGAVERTAQGAVDGAPPVFDERGAGVPDGFDNFCMERDRREDRSESARHVSRDIPGYADLDEYGTWREEQQYGWIWAPRVEIGWAPYHYGHWAWIAPWGWTWVDDAPWGFAPFHYGRWASVGAAWVWVPGPREIRRPVYSPALVAWVGGPRFNVGLSVGIGIGAAAAWFALGPGEVFMPAYHASPRYFNQVNVSNTNINRNVNITNVYNNVYVNKTTNITSVTYVNQNVNGAVAAVPREAMMGGRPIAQSRIPVTREMIAAAQIQQSSQVAPQRGAVVGGGTSTNVTPPVRALERPVVARRVPPSQVVPFSQQQQSLQTNPGQPLDNGTLNQMRVQRGGGQRPQYREAIPGNAPAAQASPQQAPPPPTQNTPRIMRRDDVGPVSGPLPEVIRPNREERRVPPQVNNPVPPPVQPPVQQRPVEPRIQQQPPPPPQRTERVEPARPPVREQAQPPQRDARPAERRERREDKREERRKDDK